MDYEQAIVAFNEVIKIDPTNVEAYLGLADVYFRLGEYENSLACIDRLLELDKENTQIKMILTECLGEDIKILTKEERYDEIETLAEKYGNIAEDINFQSVLDEANIQVEILVTEIEADHVFNMDGYGSLAIDGVGSLWDVLDENDIDDVIPPQKAVVDREGNLIFPYISTYLTYHISGSIVSLTDINAYSATEGYLWYGTEEYPPQYFHLDGGSAFELAPTTNEYDTYKVKDIVYENVTEDSFWWGSPMKDGYTLVINESQYHYGSGFASGVLEEYHSYIIDRDGTVVCTLPEEFNEEIQRGDAGFLTRYSLGWCGEGMFGVFIHNFDEKNKGYFSEVKGYMDFSGNMVLDLSGRGFTNLGSFHEGLAAVWSEDNMVGFIDKAGELVIPCIFEDCGDGFSEDGTCAVQKDGMWGYIDRVNNVVIPFEYDNAYGADGGLAAIVKDGKCGLVDYKNRIVTELEYDDISSPYNGVTYAIKDGFLYIITVR